MELQFFELKNLLIDAMEIGATRALVETGNLKPFLKLTEAYKKYGRSTVDRWIEEMLITPQKDGSKNCMVRLDRVKLEILAKSSNRISYIRHH